MWRPRYYVVGSFDVLTFMVLSPRGEAISRKTLGIAASSLKPPTFSIHFL